MTATEETTQTEVPDEHRLTVQFIREAMKADGMDWRETAPTKAYCVQMALASGRDKCGSTLGLKLREWVQTAPDLDPSQANPAQTELPEIPPVLPEAEPAPDPVQTTPVVEPMQQQELPEIPQAPTETPEPLPRETPRAVRKASWWQRLPLLVIGLSAMVAIWSGWVGLGHLAGFGPINPLPGTPWADWQIDTAITLPLGMEAYAAYAMWIWLSGRGSDRAQVFARRSALGGLVLGGAGQITYHLLARPEVSDSPWWVTMGVACLPVAVLGFAAALSHMMHTQTGTDHVSDRQTKDA